MHRKSADVMISIGKQSAGVNECIVAVWILCSPVSYPGRSHFAMETRTKWHEASYIRLFGVNNTWY